MLIIRLHKCSKLKYKLKYIHIKNKGVRKVPGTFRDFQGLLGTQKSLSGPGPLKRDPFGNTVNLENLSTFVSIAIFSKSFVTKQGFWLDIVRVNKMPNY